MQEVGLYCWRAGVVYLGRSCHAGPKRRTHQRLSCVLQGGGGANTGSRGLYPSYGSVASSVVAEATDAVR